MCCGCGCAIGDESGCVEVRSKTGLSSMIMSDGSSFPTLGWVRDRLWTPTQGKNSFRQRWWSGDEKTGDVPRRAMYVSPSISGRSIVCVCGVKGPPTAALLPNPAAAADDAGDDDECWYGWC